MRVLKWHVIDIFFNEGEEKEAEILTNKYINQGYSLEARDSGEPHDYCNQLIKWFPHNK